MQYPVHEYSKWYNAQGFGVPTDYGFHEGCDLNLRTGGDTDLGQELLAVADGEITSVCSHIKVPSFGKHLHLKCETPFGTRWFHYCHCQDILVSPGMQVKEGQLIAHLGKSGTTVAHLHFACKKEPTGVDGIAKTLDDLAKWEDPLALIERVNSTPVVEDNQYWITYKGAKLTPPYEKNPQDIITDLNAQITALNRQLSDKAAEVASLRDAIDKQDAYERQLLSERDTARTERDEAKANLKSNVDSLNATWTAKLAEQTTQWEKERKENEEALHEAAEAYIKDQAEINRLKSLKPIEKMTNKEIARYLLKRLVGR